MFLTKLRKSYSKFVSLPGKIINVIKSFSVQLYEIIIDYLFKVAKVTSNRCSGAILISLLFRIKIIYFKVIYSVENKISLNFFLIFLLNKWKIWLISCPRKISYPKKFLVTRLFLVLANMFKSLVISLVYLTNHLTNILPKLYLLCISPVTSKHSNIKATLHKVLL